MKKIYVSPRIETNDFMLEEGFMVVTVEGSGRGMGYGDQSSGNYSGFRNFFYVLAEGSPIIIAMI